METQRRTSVLVVEDDPLLRATTVAQLADDGFDVVEARAAAEAIAVIAERPEIDLLFTDVNMPGALDGVDLARHARALRPGLPVILTSGQWGRDGAEAPEGVVFVQKPYAATAVAQLVRALVKAT